MEMFSPSPVDACVFIRLISLAELAAFEADTQTGRERLKIQTEPEMNEKVRNWTQRREKLTLCS